MPKNIFEELAINQRKEELARIKILSRIKAGDIKGAHRIAKPYLEMLSKRSPNENIPTGWVHISKTLCAVDIQQYGVSKIEMGRFPKQENWINTSLEIISTRAKGFIKALVPASMAIALIVQAIGPTKINAANIPNNVATYVSLDLAGQKENDKKNQKLDIELIEQGTESLPKSLNDRLQKEIHMNSPKQKQSIKWSVGNVSRNQSTKLIEAELIAQNISTSEVSVSQFAMTDSRYEGCQIKDPNNLEPYEATSTNSPSEIPPGACAVYKVTIAKTKSPQIIFRTAKGELHSMRLNLNGFDKLSDPLKRKSWAQYKLTNKGSETLELTPQITEGVKLSKLKISDGAKELNIEAPQGSLILKPQQVATLLVEANEKYSPELELISKSQEENITYKLKTNPLTNMMWGINQTYNHLMNLIFSDEEKNLGWEDVKVRVDASMESLTSESGSLYRADDLMVEVAKGGLLEESHAKENSQITQSPSFSLSQQKTNSLELEKIMEKMSLQQDKLAKQAVKKYKSEAEIQ